MEESIRRSGGGDCARGDDCETVHVEAEVLETQEEMRLQVELTAGQSVAVVVTRVLSGVWD